MKTDYLNPIHRGADPFILLYDNNYYLYATNAADGFKVSASSDLVNWEDKGYCLKKGDAIGEKWFWAPEVVFFNNKFYMVYTADKHVAVATSDSPLGPFKQTEMKWLLDYEAIDGHFFIDDDGAVYMYYRHVMDNRICGVKMAQDMNSVIGDTNTVLLIPKESGWERVDPTKFGSEGPFVLKHNGKYYLTYSSNDYTSPDYAVGCATADSPLGEYTKYDHPILRKSETVVGTGHHSFTYSKDLKRIICVYHKHFSLDSVEPRMTCIDEAEFDENGVLKVFGPTDTLQNAIY